MPLSQLTETKPHLCVELLYSWICIVVNHMYDVLAWSKRDVG